MSVKSIVCACALSIACAGLVTAHGGAHNQKPIIAKDADWTTRHMADEHHIAVFDAASFFTLHDYDSSGFWDEHEILKTYGLTMPHDSPYATHVSSERAAGMLQEVMKLMDSNGDGMIQKDEWLTWYATGNGLPDFGTGPGHHGDDEYEYEIHHWEKYHDENTKEEDLTHPEDIAHFKHHDDLEDEEDRQAAIDKMNIVEQNIPQMFRRA